VEPIRLGSLAETRWSQFPNRINIEADFTIYYLLFTIFPFLMATILMRRLFFHRSQHTPGYNPNSILAGSSNASLTATRNCTASLPSMMR